jgi:hypothetical protein
MWSVNLISPSIDDHCRADVGQYGDLGSKNRLILEMPLFPRRSSAFPISLLRQILRCPPLKQFTEAIQGKLPDVTWGNADDLVCLSTEFGFEDLRNAIARFTSGDDDKERRSVHDPEKVQTLLSEFDSAILMTTEKCWRPRPQ